MLQKLNERIQGLVAWLVVILIGITFTLFGVDYYMQSHQVNNAKATVNGEPITEQAFETNYRRARGVQDTGQMTAEDEKSLQNQVLNQMVTHELLVQAAAKNGFSVSNNQANAAILSIPQFQEDGHFSAAKYQQALSAALFTQSSFQNEVKQGMLLNQQRFAFSGTSFAFQDEIERFVKLYMQTRDYKYLTIPVAQFVKDAHITDEQIKNYYEQHKKDFMDPEKVSLEYVLLSMNEVKKNISITSEEAKRFYDENTSNYLTPAQWKVSHILFTVPENASEEEQDKIQKIAEEAYSSLQKNPEQFTEMVKKSDDKLSIAEEGELPWITAGQNEYNKYLSQITKPGQITPPIRTPHGYEIFKLIDYKPVTTQSFAKVESTIKEQLANETAQTRFSQAMEQLSDLSYQSPDSLSPVADALKLTIKQTDLFPRSGGVHEITKNSQVINAAYSHDVLQLGNNSEPIQLDNDSVIVVRLKDHTEQKQLPLTAVKTKIQSLLEKQYAEQRAKELGDKIKDKNSTNMGFNSPELKWNIIESAARDSDKVDAAINELAFSLPRVHARDGIMLPNGDYTVVALTAIHDGQMDSLDEEQKNSLEQQIEASYGTMDYDLYVKSLINQAIVTRN